MTKFNGLILASVKAFSQGTPDKNGKDPVILTVVAGSCPNRHVMSGTIAESAGFEVDHTYLIKVSEGETDPTYGRRFTFIKIGEPSMLEVMQSEKLLGRAEIFNVSANAEVEDAAEVTSVFNTVPA